MKLYGKEIDKVIHRPAKFGGYKHCVRGDILVFVVLWCNLNSGYAEVRILLVACRRLMMVKISDNFLDWKQD